MWFVYLLRCENGSLYCGITKNIINRYHKHVEGKGATYTKIHKPVLVEYIEGPYSSRSKASKREYEIKQYRKQKKETLIKEQYQSLC